MELVFINYIVGGWATRLETIQLQHSMCDCIIVVQLTMRLNSFCIRIKYIHACSSLKGSVCVRIMKLCL